MRKLWLIIFLALLVCNSALADTVLLRAVSEKYKGKRVGAIYLNKEVVVRLYSRGKYQSPYNRAKVVVEKMRDLVDKGIDLRSIKLMKGTTATVGIADNREIFRIYERDVKANNSTPASLGKAWLINIKNVIETGKVDPEKPEKVAKSQPRKKQVVQEKTSREKKKPVEHKSQAETTKQKGQVNSPEEESAIKVSTDKQQDTGENSSHDELPPEVGKAGAAEKSIFVSPLYTTILLISFALIFVMLILLIVIFVIQLKRFRLQKQGIVSHSSSEEIENLVSHLITELETKASEVTTDFEEKISYLENVMHKAEESISNIKEQNRPEPESNVEFSEQAMQAAQEEEEQADDEEKIDEESLEGDPDGMSAINKPQRTKQEIIYEMADQGSSVTDIAKKLGIGKGEVQLILDLKQ